MDDDTLRVASRFHGGPSATALVCPEILSGSAILCVCRKNNVWQFLCGLDHSDEDVYEENEGDPRLTTVLRVVALDPSVGHVATMHDRHIMRRRGVADRWVPEDDLSYWWM